MKPAVLIVFVLLGVFASAKAPSTEETMNLLKGFAQNVAGEYKEQFAEFMADPINSGNITEILINFGSGFATGLFDASGHGKASKCFANIKNVTEVYKYIMDIIAHGLEKEPVKMVRQVLVLGVMLLNVLIEEYQYCQDVTYFYDTFYSTFECITRCPTYYMSFLGGNLLRKTYDYFYYFKESLRYFFAKDYHYSGVWMAYGFNSVVLLSGRTCSYISCPSPLHSE